MVVLPPVLVTKSFAARLALGDGVPAASGSTFGSLLRCRPDADNVALLVSGDARRIAELAGVDDFHSRPFAAILAVMRPCPLIAAPASASTTSQMPT